MAVFRAFKPEAMNKIAKSMGYTGNMGQFQDFIEQDPARQARMEQFKDAAVQMARGGVVRMREGGFQQTMNRPVLAGGVNLSRPAILPIAPQAESYKQLPQQAVPSFKKIPDKKVKVTQYRDDKGKVYEKESDAPKGTKLTSFEREITKKAGIGDVMVQQAMAPGLPQGGAVAAVGTEVTKQQTIDPRTGQVAGSVAVDPTLAKTQLADDIKEKEAATYEAEQSAQKVEQALKATEVAKGTVSDDAIVKAEQQSSSSVSELEAAQGKATLIDNPVQRKIQDGELISGSADAATAAKFTEQVQAATATPSKKATVKGQLDDLMDDFEGGDTPAWAAGAMRAATSAMAARGLGSSSLAGQAIVQAAMESALPIAQADAATQSQFEAQNLSNRQQRAMLSAQQRAQFIGQEFDQAFQSRVLNASKIADVANMNFTAEQQVQLENSRAANTMNLNNLSNSQAMVMAEASALAQMDSQNLNNRQQAAVQNAQSFLNMDMTNLSNQQQTNMFKAQQRVQSMFTDQAATNAAKQFNATSQSQTDQFFANLASQTSQFNASQFNAQQQFNAGQTNTIERFNAELNNQRDQFNAQNQLVIAQSNAQWRREVATANTAAINRANELNATAVLDISKTAYDNLWQYHGDTMEWAWKSAENQLDRISSMAIAELDAKTRAEVQKSQAGSSAGSAVGSLIGTLGTAWIGSWCWVAREVYGKQDTRWFIFRVWLQYDAPKWFKNFYGKYGERYAKFISNKPTLKWATKKLMDLVVESKRKTHHVQSV